MLTPCTLRALASTSTLHTEHSKLQRTKLTSKNEPSPAHQEIISVAGVRPRVTLEGFIAPRCGLVVYPCGLVAASLRLVVASLRFVVA